MAQKNNQNAVKLTLPKYDVLGKSPSWFNKTQSGIWDEIAASIHPDLLCKSDRTSLEIFVNLLIEYRSDPAKFSASKLALLAKYQSNLGLSPAARASIKQPTPAEKKEDKKPNIFAEY